jgi:alpha-tubulin suppressor-like RCC1 family protein
MKLLGYIKFSLLVAIIAGTSACSMKDRKEVHSVSVQLPQEWSRIKSSVGSMLIGNVSSVADFDCYGLNVTGPGIQLNPHMGCTNPSTAMGMVAGFVPVTEGSIEMMVPAGASRKVELIGVQSNIGCPIVESLLASGGVEALNDIGDAYVIGTITTDIFDDTAVTIQAAFDPDHFAFDGCMKPEPMLPVEIVSPITDTFINSQLNTTGVDVSGFCNQDGSTITIKFGATVVATTTCSDSTFFASAVSTSSLAQGIHSLSATMTTGSGTMVSNLVSLTKDTVSTSSATSLSWVHSNPTKLTSLTSSWTKSASTELDHQVIQYFSDGSCNTMLGSPVYLSNLADNNFYIQGATHGQTFSYRVYSYDLAENETTSVCSIPITIDTVASTPAITTPANNSFINIANNSATFNVNGTCDSGESLNILVNGVGKATAGCAAGAFSATVNVTSFNEETYTFSLNSTDAAGNVGESSGVTVTKDITAPVVSITNPIHNSYINQANQSSYSVSGSCSKNGANVGIILASVNIGAVSCIANSYSISGVDVSGISDGVHSLTVEIEDLAGNTSATAPISIIKDTSPPSAAYALTWMQTSPSNVNMVSASWTKSGSADLDNQKIQFYKDSTCTAVMGAEINLNSTSVTPVPLDGLYGETYTYKLMSFDTAGNVMPSDCSSNYSSPMVINFPQTLSSGGYSTCRVKNNGTIECWGKNTYGQLGNGSYADSLVPVPVSIITAGATAVSIGIQHACAIVNGNVKCWGLNGNGQLGDGTTTNSTTPVTVPVLSGVTSISVGTNSTCAVASGIVKCWGGNASGQLGNGTTTSSTTPVNVSVLSAGVKAVSVNDLTACAINAAGAVFCWGEGTNGQLGNGTTVSSSSPVPVSGLTSGVSSIAVGGVYSCAIQNRGAFCWGQNLSGQLGNGGTTQSSVPVQVTGITAGAVAISAGFSTTCAIVSGAVKCWGQNTLQQFGNNSRVSSPTPVSVSGLSTGVSEISLRRNQSCAVVNGSQYCWGSNTEGQLGNGTIAKSNNPIAVSSMSALVSSISAGERSACSLKNGSAYCWGSNENGNLGDNSLISSDTPVQVVGLSTGVSDISSSDTHACAVVNGAAKCWGSNNNGALGNGTSGGYVMSPVQVNGLTAGVVQVVTGKEFSCALINDGTVKCWGVNTFGQLGNASNTSANTPVPVNSLTGVTAISTSNYSGHVCSVNGSGNVYCWGNNSNGQLGVGNTIHSNTPVFVSGVSGATKVSVSNAHTCAVSNSGSAYCWGYNAFGQLGNSTNTNSSTPVTVSTLSVGVLSISAGYYYSCAVMTSGALKCWGRNDSGQLGNATFADTNSPVQTFGSGVSSVSGGRFSACATMNTGEARCWGSNEYGQLGSAFGLASVPTLIP